MISAVKLTAVGIALTILLTCAAIAIALSIFKETDAHAPGTHWHESRPTYHFHCDGVRYTVQQLLDYPYVTPDLSNERHLPFANYLRQRTREDGSLMPVGIWRNESIVVGYTEMRRSYNYVVYCLSETRYTQSGHPIYDEYFSISKFLTDQAVDNKHDGTPTPTPRPTSRVSVDGSRSADPTPVPTLAPQQRVVPLVSEAVLALYAIYRKAEVTCKGVTYNFMAGDIANVDWYRTGNHRYAYRLPDNAGMLYSVASRSTLPTYYMNCRADGWDEFWNISVTDESGRDTYDAALTRTPTPTLTPTPAPTLSPTPAATPNANPIRVIWYYAPDYKRLPNEQDAGMVDGVGSNGFGIADTPEELQMLAEWVSSQ